MNGTAAPEKIALLGTLASYVPALILRRLESDPTPIAAPTEERFPAAVLFTDITGFTRLTERLAKQGLAGIEGLSQVLSTYFGRAIEVLTAHGGDVVKFAGDAIIAIWPAWDEDLPTVALRAAQGGLALQAALQALAVTAAESLTMRSALGVGDMAAVHLGGERHRWEFFLAGAPLVQVSRTQRYARPGQVALSAEACQLIGARCELEPLVEENARLLAVRDAFAPAPARSFALTAEAETALWAYVPGAVRSRLIAGQTGWLAELRQATVLFVNLPDLNYTTSLDRAQAMMRDLQTILYRYEGSVNKISVDEKGITLVAALGLPPLAHEDDAARAVRAAQAMQARLVANGVRSLIGVTSGVVFCGVIGTLARREYTMIGSTVNLSARLMQAAARLVAENPAALPQPILCDTSTYEAACAHLTFVGLPPVAAKGFDDPVPVFRPTGEKQARLQPRGDIVGRKAELAQIEAQLRALLDGASGVIVIEGEAGIGKTRLVEAAARAALRLGVTLMRGAGDAVELATPYYAWRDIFGHLLGQAATVGPSSDRRQIFDMILHALIGDRPELQELIPLLDPLMPFNVPDNDHTAQLRGAARADNTRTLLLTLLQITARQAPRLVILEDAQWLDSASWTLALEASRQVQPLLLLIVTRPLTETAPTEGAHLLHAPGVVRLPLNVLSPTDAEALVCQRLGVTSLPAAVATLIHIRAEDHPLFTEELAYALRDAGYIEVVDGECQVAADVDLNAVTFPDTVQGIITGRVDRLTPQQQLALKVASVIGQLFAFDTLQDVYPLAPDRPLLREALTMLETLDLTRLLTPDPDLAYVFKHVIIREVTYHLLPFALRRQLHQAVAEWYEQRHAHDLEPFYPLLAYHWSNALDQSRPDPAQLAKTLDYLQEAAEQARLGGAYRETVSFLKTAVQWGEAEPAPRRARWQRLLAEAYRGLGDLEHCLLHARAALQALDYPDPANLWRLGASLAQQMAAQVARRLHLRRCVLHGRDHTPEVLEAARAYLQIAEVAYFKTEVLRTFHAAFTNLNLMESLATETPELARALAVFPMGLTVFQRPDWSDAFAQRAIETARRIGDLPTLAQVLQTISMYFLGMGRWREMAQYLTEAVELADHLGDRHLLGRCLVTWANAAAYRGEYAALREYGEQLYQLGQRTDEMQQLGWGLNVRGMAARYTGADVESAVSHLEAGYRYTVRIEDTISASLNRGVAAMLYVRLGQLDAARNAVAEILSRLAHVPMFYSEIESYTGLLEALLALEAAAPTRAEKRVARQQIRRALRGCLQLATIVPLGWARYWLFVGRNAALQGNLLLARTAWRKSLAISWQLTLPYEEGLAHYYLGLYAAGNERRSQLERAVELFTALGASYDLTRAQEALAIPTNSAKPPRRN